MNRKTLMFAEMALLLSVGSILTFSSALAETSSSVNKEIENFVGIYFDAYQKKDVGTIMSLIAPDPDVVFVDSGEDQFPNGRYEGAEQIRKLYEREFEQVKGLRVKHDRLSTGHRGNLAWFTTDFIADVDLGEEKLRVPGRWTAVVEKREGKWLILHSHLSFPPSD